LALAVPIGVASADGSTADGACEADAGCEPAGQLHEYCIIGAGPGGLQIGHLMHRSGMNYRIFDAAPHAGAFFGANPVHRTLISLNKRYSGQVRRGAPRRGHALPAPSWLGCHAMPCHARYVSDLSAVLHGGGCSRPEPELNLRHGE